MPRLVEQEDAKKAQEISVAPPQPLCGPYMDSQPLYVHWMRVSAWPLLNPYMVHIWTLNPYMCIGCVCQRDPSSSVLVLHTSSSL